LTAALVAVVVFDLVRVWLGLPVAGCVNWWCSLRWRRCANAAGGWPVLIAVRLHSAAPLMLLAMVEAEPKVLLRRIGQAKGTLRRLGSC
jgi:hypothetical protein